MKPVKCAITRPPHEGTAWLRRGATATLLLLSMSLGIQSVAASNAIEVLEGQVRAAPDDIRAGNDLRQSCRARKTFERCIELFEALAKKHPAARAAQYHAALAYVDHLPGHSLLQQARLSTKSMEFATAVLDQRPQDWLALYIRGLNNLYWPTWYRRTDKAIADLTRCTELTQNLPPEQRREYMGLAYLALGDAFVKQGKAVRGREVWQRGAAMHAHPQLLARLDIDAAALPQAIDDIRSREVPVDTDIAFYFAEYTGKR